MTVVQVLVFSASDVSLVSRLEAALDTDVAAARMAVQLLDQEHEARLYAHGSLSPSQETDGVAELVVGSPAPAELTTDLVELFHMSAAFRTLTVTASEADGGIDLGAVVDAGPARVARVGLDESIAVLAGSDVVVLARPVHAEDGDDGWDSYRWHALPMATHRQRQAALEVLLAPDPGLSFGMSLTRDPSTGGYHRDEFLD